MRRSRTRATAAGIVLGLAIVASGCAPSAARREGAAPSPSVTATAGAAPRGGPSYTAADVHFMSGMIRHHAQAILMAGWAPTHGASAAIQVLCERIVVGQRDEIAVMQGWLRAHREEVPDGDPADTYGMPGMDHGMLMPGMLTPEQLTALDHARDADFDRLFLEGMIMHHRGAITMVEQLFGSEGAAQDETVFKFASDVSADQSIEIERMSGMIEALSPTRGTP